MENTTKNASRSLRSLNDPITLEDQCEADLYRTFRLIRKASENTREH